MDRRTSSVQHEGGNNPWNSSNLKPVGIALASAIVICAIPMAYRIAVCPNVNASLSLSDLISFSCKAQPKTDYAESHAVSREQLSAPTLNAPLGYVAYRVDSGIARDIGSIAPFDGSLAPSFSQVKSGLILVANAQKRLRERPFSQSKGIVLPQGQCLRIVDGFHWADEVPANGRSGGWLPAQSISCPSVGADTPKPPFHASNQSGLDATTSTPRSKNNASTYMLLAGEHSCQINEGYKYRACWITKEGQKMILDFPSALLKIKGILISNADTSYDFRGALSDDGKDFLCDSKLSTHDLNSCIAQPLKVHLTHLKGRTWSGQMGYVLFRAAEPNNDVNAGMIRDPDETRLTIQ